MTHDSDEWGAWVEHDGKGCPLPAGTVTQAVFEDLPNEFSAPIIGVVGSGGGYSWDWAWWCKQAPDGYFCSRIVRYRVRRPKALRDMIERIAALPGKVNA